MSGELPVIDSCDNCGVCCWHMGYPTFMLPREPQTMEQIRHDDQCQLWLNQGWTVDELLEGHPGEPHWHRLPEELRVEWLSFVGEYEKPESLDGPCFWLDRQTGKCKHHVFRPNVCRDFEIGSDGCRAWRKHYHIE